MAIAQNRAQQRNTVARQLRCWFRNGVYLIVVVLAIPWLLVRACSSKGLPTGLGEKFLGPRRPPPVARTPRLWLHGVSVGEVQLLASLIKRLQEAPWEVDVVLSSTTHSGMQLANRLLPETPKFYFPFDFSWSVKSTLRQVAPSMIVLGELEVWPNLIELAGQRGIPVVIINGRLSENSFRGYQRLSWLARRTFGGMSAVGAQSTTYAERFRLCGCPPECVQVTGNLKFDNVRFDSAAPQVDELRHLIRASATDRLLVVGSTQDPEELAAAQAFLSLRPQFPELKLVVVPRHPERFDQVYRQLCALPTQVVRRSALPEALQDAEWEILLVDTVGELKWWWGLAEIAVVGGSFGKRGGQNMLEPAAYGVNVAFGPNTSNFKDVAELLLAAGGAVRLPNLEVLPAWLQSQLEHPQEGRQRGAAARKVIKQQQGATQRTITLLQALLD